MNELIVLTPAVLTPAIFEKAENLDKLLADLRARVKSEETDISTAQGRAHIKSLSYQVSRSKTALDALGKQLGEDWRKRVDGINADRRRIRDELDALADEVRAPLTEWENTEKARVDGHEHALIDIFALAAFIGEPEIAEIERRLDLADPGRGPERDWQEFAKRAHDTKIAVTADLTAARDHWTGVYRDRAEAERVRQEEVARVQREREATIGARAAEEAKREAEAKAARDAAAAEERARRQREAAAEKARQEREAAEAPRLAEVRAREEAEERARQAEARRIAQIELAARDRVAAEQKAERDRLQAIEDERARVAAEQQALADAGAAREADRKHKAKIHREARDAIMLAMVDIAKSATTLDPSASVFAEAVVSAIARGLVPHVRITY